MHPSCALIVWLSAVLAAQNIGYPGLAVLALLPLIWAPATFRRWLELICRARWLLLTLWLIMAYNAPGEAWLDQSWAPTHEGMAEGSLQVARLSVLLLWLAWLFVRLQRDLLVSAVWGLLQPARTLGLEVERLVVRLSLVLENLQAPQERGAWRRMLRVEMQDVAGPDAVYLTGRPWRLRDTALVVVCAAGLLGVWVR